MEQCPAKWVFEKYVKNFVVPEEQDTAARRGNVFHDIMEAFFKEEPEDRTTKKLASITKKVISTKYPDFKDNAEVIQWVKDAVRGYYQMGGRPEKVKVAKVLKHKNKENEDDEIIDGLEVFVKGKIGKATRETLGYIDQIIEDQKKPDSVIISDWKGLALDTPLPTFRGWTTMGEVSIGDKLIGSFGEEITVKNKSQIHNRECYKLTFDDGSEVISDNVHLWKVSFVDNTSHTSYTKVINTQALYHEKQALNGFSLRIKNSSPVKYDTKNLPIDPYALGVWLGHNVAGTEENTRRFLDDFFKENTDKASFIETLKREELLDNKNIPLLYLRSDIEQRKELLKGLMDSNGYWDSHNDKVLFCTTEKSLSDNVVELIASLGITPYPDKEEYKGEMYYEVGFTPVEFNPFKLSKRGDLAQDFLKNNASDSILSTYRVIKSIEKVESVPTQCIEVDAEDSMFLCGKLLIPTHNSGAKHKKFNKNSASNDGFNEVRQQIIYSMLIEQRDVKVSSARLVYPIAGLVAKIDVDDDELRVRVIESIENADNILTDSIENNTFEYGPSFLCSWCPLVKVCPVADKKPFKKAVDSRAKQPSAEDIERAVIFK